MIDKAVASQKGQPAGCGVPDSCLFILDQNGEQRQHRHGGGHQSGAYPEEQFAVVKQARDAGLEIIAAYHSHPEGPSKPSAEDIRLALDPGFIHVIVSPDSPEPSIRAFRIDEGEVMEAPISLE